MGPEPATAVVAVSMYFLALSRAPPPGIEIATNRPVAIPPASAPTAENAADFAAPPPAIT
jgi:hypothetical protein